MCFSCFVLIDFGWLFILGYVGVRDYVLVLLMGKNIYIEGQVRVFQVIGILFLGLECGGKVQVVEDKVYWGLRALAGQGQGQGQGKG